MTRLSPADIADLRARNPLERVAQELGAVLRRTGRTWTGTCPVCGGGKAATRFEIKRADKWVCAVCQDGGDVIKLVQKVTGVSFREAVERLGGVRVLSDAERETIDRDLAAKKRQRDAEAEKYRLEELDRIRAIWRTAALGDLSDVEAYLRARNLEVPHPLFARAVESMPYFHGTFVSADDPYQRSLPRVIHNGPAMLAAMQDNDGVFCGLHITWIDRYGAKARIFDPDNGERLPSKKMRGSTKAAHINLIACRTPKRLFLGEGNETVLSPWTALRRTNRLRDTDGFWAAGSLGALAGPAIDTIGHPTLKTPGGRPQRVPGPDPDYEAPGLEIPACVEELVLLGDGDSDPFTTQMALARAAKRHHRHARTIRSVFADQGFDFNDALRAADPAESEAA